MATPKMVFEKTLSPEAWAHFEGAMNALPPLIVQLVRYIDDNDETQTMEMLEKYAKEWVKNANFADKHPIIDLTSTLSGRILKIALDEAIKWQMALGMAKSLFEMIDEVIDE